MSERKCSEDAKDLIQQLLLDHAEDLESRALDDEFESTVDSCKQLESFIATLEHRNAALERVVEAAMDVEPPCDYDVFSGHDQEDEHREDCAACELKDALRALDGEGK